MDQELNLEATKPLTWYELPLRAAAPEERSMSPFAFKDIPEYLEALRAPKAARKRPLTLGQLSRHLGYRSPRTIAMVIKGQRKPSLELVERLSTWQCLSIREREYLSVL